MRDLCEIDGPCPTGRYQTQMAGETQTVEEKERFVRLTVAAARLDCHPKTLKELVVGGQIAAVRLSPRGHWRISERALDELIERSRR